MSITTGQNGNASDFISRSQKDATPSNDAGRVPKLESDGKVHGFFTKNGQVLNAGATINGATLPVPVYQDKTDNEVYACDGNDTTKLKFVGFATSNGTDANPIDVQFVGVVGGFSGLNEGEKYYLSDTAGAISDSPGTYEVLVGIAISPTELLIQKGQRYANGVASFADAGNAGQVSNSAITTGFRPSLIRISALSRSQAYIVHSFGSWMNGLHRSAYIAKDDDGSTVVSGTSTSYAAYIVDPDTTERWTITITSVSDTGFTISAEQKNNNVDNLVLSYEVFGHV